MTRLGPGDLRRFMDHPGGTAPLLLDVREPWEFAICHIDGAENVPMGRVPEWADDEDRNRDIVVICHHGVRSLQVGFFLENAGFTRVHNLDGGVDAWARTIDPSMSMY